VAEKSVTKLDHPLYSWLCPLWLLAAPKTKTCFEGTQIWWHFWYPTSCGERTKDHSRCVGFFFNGSIA
jgi:hypothetical protein